MTYNSKADVYSICLKCINTCKIKGLGELMACPKFRRSPPKVIEKHMKKSQGIPMGYKP